MHMLFILDIDTEYFEINVIFITSLGRWCKPFHFKPLMIEINSSFEFCKESCMLDMAFGFVNDGRMSSFG